MFYLFLFSFTMAKTITLKKWCTNDYVNDKRLVSDMSFLMHNQ